MNTTALRQKILDLAIHGKLVKQDPTDENAAVLLEKISAEKEKKIASGELKRDKNDSYIFIGDDNRHYEKFADGRIKDIEDELPFAVPEGWAWCRLPNILISIFAGGDRPIICEKTQSDKCNIPIYSNGIENNGLYGFTNKPVVNVSSITISARGTIGFSCIRYEPFVPIVRLITIIPFTKYIDLVFLKIAFDTLFSFSEGSSIPQLTVPTIKQFLIPLPPIAEQKRIVTAIETIFAQIDLLEQNKRDLQTAIKQAKSKILDLAIHGKLVPQDPNDELASVMLEKLRAEKEAKIAAGKMKRDKNNSYIYKNAADNCYYQKFTDGYEADISDEIPFDVPDGWAWCRLGEIYYHTTGKALKKSNEKGSLKKYITTSNLYWDTFDLSEVRTMYFTDDELDKYTIKKGDLVLCNGGDVGRAAIWSYDKDICYQNHISRMRPKTNGIENRFFLYVLKFYKEQNMLKGKGIGISSLSASDLLSVIIPLPSLFEQQRIVAKIEELFAKLDFITAVLTE